MVVAMKKLMLSLIALFCVLGFWFPAGAASNPKLDALVTKIDRLEEYVYDNNWQNIRTYIRGPLGEVRRELNMLQRNLPSNQRVSFKAASSQFLNDLITLDFAALDQNPDRTEAAFKTLRTDLDKMINVLE